MDFSCNDYRIQQTTFMFPRRAGQLVNKQPSSSDPVQKAALAYCQFHLDNTTCVRKMRQMEQSTTTVGVS